MYHAPQWCVVEVNVPELEQRLLNLQWQLDRLWQVAEGNVQSVDQRLAGMAEQYAENLKRWAVTAERHGKRAQLDIRD